MRKRPDRVRNEPTVMICVGATKAGTSWLHRYLFAHPDCHMPSVKELHYFTKTEPNHFDGALAAGKAEIAALKSTETAIGKQRLADLRAWQEVLRLRVIDPAAYRWFLMSRAGSAKVVGDVTPAYALMPEDKLREMAQVAKDVRVVYLMRDPLARLWSHVRMIGKRSGASDFGGACVTLLERILANDLSGEGRGIVERGDYASNHTKLVRAIDPAKRLVLFTENLMTQPGVACLTTFLGLRTVPADFDHVVHEGQRLAMPAQLRARALAWLRPQYDYVASQFGEMPANWRANMEEGFA